jgi:hypothetical protein
MIVIMAVVFLSCSKDDLDDTGSNQFIIDGEKFLLSKAYVRDYGPTAAGSFDFDVILTSSSIAYDDQAGEFNGKGHAVFIDLNSSSSNGLADGSYYYSRWRNHFTFYSGEVATDFDVDNETGNVHPISSGTVDITMDGNTLTIEFDLGRQNKTSVTGNYTGILQSI